MVYCAVKVFSISKNRCSRIYISFVSYSSVSKATSEHRYVCCFSTNVENQSNPPVFVCVSLQGAESVKSTFSRFVFLSI